MPSSASLSEPSARGRLFAWLIGYLRRTWWVVAAVLLFSLATLVRLKTSVEAELGAFGERVATWAEMSHAFGGSSDEDGERALFINGLTLRIETQILESDLQPHLDRLATECPSGEANVTASDAYFLCVHAVDQDGWVSRVSDFMESQDVANLGPIEYTYLRAVEGGTLAVTLSPEGSFVLDDMVPNADRDVPGRDIEGFERPRGSKRVLFAEEIGEPYSVVMYGDPSRTPDELLQHIRANLDRERFTELDLAEVARREGEEYDEPILYLLDGSRPGGFVVVHVAAPDRATGFKSYATMMEAR